MLKQQSIYIPELKQWLHKLSERKRHLLSWKIQNEIIQMFSIEILNVILADIKKAKYFSIMSDGTQDMSRKEQEAICIRYVDSNLNIKEEFIGNY